MGCVGTASFFQPPANAVSHNRVANLLGDRNAEPRRALVAAIQHFKQKKPSTPFFTTADSQKIGTLLKARRGVCDWPVHHISGLACKA